MLEEKSHIYADVVFVYLKIEIESHDMNCVSKRVNQNEGIKIHSFSMHDQSTEHMRQMV